MLACLLMPVSFVNAISPIAIDIRQDTETGLYVNKGVHYKAPAVVSLNGTISGVGYYYGDSMEVSAVLEPTAIVVFGANNEIWYTNQFNAGNSKSITKIERW